MFKMSRCLLLLALLPIVFWGCAAAKGDFALSMGNYEEAISHYRKQLQENPSDWSVRENIGYVYLKMGDTAAAAEELKAVCAGNPSSGRAIVYLAVALLRMDDPHQALSYLREYKSGSEPIVDEKVAELISIVAIADSKQLVRKALADEQTLTTSGIKPNSYAVFYYKDNSPDKRLKAVQKALAMMIITDLAKVKSISVVERIMMQALIDEMKLGQTGIVEKKTAPRAGRLLGAESLVIGNIDNPGPLLDVNTSVASTPKQKVVLAFGVNDKLSEFFKIEKEIVYNILKKSKIVLDNHEKCLIDAFHTKNYKAFVYYGQGLDAFDAGSWKAARNYFRRALQEDPNFALAQEALSGTPSGTLTLSIQQLAQPTSNQLSNIAEAAAEDAYFLQKEVEEEDKGGAGGGGGGC